VTGAAAETAGAAAEVAGVELVPVAAEATVDAADVTGAAAEVTDVAAEGSEPVPLLLSGAATEVTVPDPEPEPVAAEDVLEAVEVTGAAAGVVTEAMPVPELVPVAAGVTGAAAEVTGAAAEVTGAAAEVEPDPELVSVPVPTLEPVTAGVTGDAAEVTGPVAELTLEPELAGRAAGLVAAFACREKTSKTTRIPAAVIATCIARRAMSRTIGCGISSSPLSGQTPRAPRQRPETRERTLIQALFSPDFSLFSSRNHPETDIAVRPRMYMLIGHHRTATAWARVGTTDPR
jgi:hypothetical protein